MGHAGHIDTASRVVSGLEVSYRFSHHGHLIFEKMINLGLVDRCVIDAKILNRGELATDLLEIHSLSSREK